MSACRCWSNNYAIGHDGHCCFLRDDRSRKLGNGFREDADICHSPETSCAYYAGCASGSRPCGYCETHCLCGVRARRWNADA